MARESLERRKSESLPLYLSPLLFPPNYVSHSPAIDGKCFMSHTSTFEQEVSEGKRFEFGKNWNSFLNTLDDERIEIAQNSITDMLEVETLEGLSFLDIGCGSGLFSLVARKLGARVHSFDFDPNSVACAIELRNRYFPNDDGWSIEEGSVLDDAYMKKLGTFDIVYSWGVLHHTGEMWKAIGNAVNCIHEEGRLYIAIYNDEGVRSRVWRSIKKTYCSGALGKAAMSAFFIPYFLFRSVLRSLVRRENEFTGYRKRRGMSIMHDYIDWLGGYPFEVASVEEIFKYFKTRAYTLTNIKTTNSLGCNQFVFKRTRDNAI